MNTISPERWLPFPDAPDYEISDLGRVRRAKANIYGRWLGHIKTLSQHRGYLHLRILLNGRTKNYNVQRAVLRAFVGEPPTPHHEAAHYNGDRHDNRLCNLRWATSIENALDNIRLGRKATCLPVLTADQVQVIRERKRMGESDRTIAKDYGVTYGTIRSIAIRKSWKAVP